MKPAMFYDDGPFKDTKKSFFTVVAKGAKKKQSITRGENLIPALVFFRKWNEPVDKLLRAISVINQSIL